jgi:succinate-semialdehyde dehydrogenase/glutarate-semialdehyde dehydrogenase
MTTSFTSLDPVSGRPLEARPETSDAELDDALGAAHEAQRRWARTPLSERSALLSRVARALEEDAHDLAALATRTMGKPFLQAVAEIRKCAWSCRHFAEHGLALLADEVVATEAASTRVVHRPLGVIFAIMPWNFPFWQLFRFGAPALLAGNAILLKHAPATMSCGDRVADLFRKAGAPRGLVQHVAVSTQTAERLIAHPHIAGVTLTGSTRAGRSVAAAAGAALKPCVLELGGSDAFIVMPSADLKEAASVAVASRTGNNGQSCIAAKRFLVHQEVAAAFEAAVVEGMRALRVGNPMDERTDVGPLVSAEAREALQGQVEGSVEAGARLVLGGAIPAGAGFFYPPTVLADVPPGARAMTEEVFGPVMALATVDSFEEALVRANDSAYGLCASVWTKDRGEQLAAERGLEVGGVFINAMSRSDPRLPFGGVRDSGFGRELGRSGLLSFTNACTVWVA